MYTPIIRELAASACLLALTGQLYAGAIPIAVTTTDDVSADDGECSLREAIVNANNNDQSGSVDCQAGDLFMTDTIMFHPDLSGGTIVLNGTALPKVTEGLNVTGPDKFDPDGLTIDAGGASRIFHAEGSIPLEFQLRLSFLTLTGGATTGAHEHGGAVFTDNASLRLSFANILDSSTAGFQAWGGGAAVIGGNANLNTATLSGNSTAGSLAAGGGLMVNGALQMVTSSVVGNLTLGDNAIGGGIAVSDSADIIGSTIAENATYGSDADGGGIVVLTSNLHLENSTLSGNGIFGTGADAGGALVSGGELTMLHTTAAFNRAPPGATAGVVMESTNPAHAFTLLNSVVAQRDGEAACNQQADTATNSLATDTTCTGTTTDLEDLNLLPLDNYGGPGGLALQTHAFFAPSSLLDQAGDCDVDHGITTDQRAEPRPGSMTAACDIGAYELQGPIEPGLQIVPVVLDLGSVPLGETSANGIVEFVSTGNTPLELMIMALPQPTSPFEFLDMICDQDPSNILDPGERCTLEFSFTPDSTGSASEMLQVSSNDPGSPHSYQLQGLGTEPAIDLIFTDRFAQQDKN